jgi:periplasmic divalent cation tolerance protein
MIKTTVDDANKAQEMAELLVRERLAACVHRTLTKSTYTWKGAIESADEITLTAKTRESLIERVIACIRKNHPYEVPEIIVTPIVQGFQPYLDWIEEETKQIGVGK